MIAYSIMSKKNLYDGLIFDPEHYHPARLSAMSALQSQSSYKLSDFFEEITDLVAPGDNVQQEKVFDLTDALGCLLDSGDCPMVIGSTKKRTQSGDLIISRLRSYLKEFCIVPPRGDSFTPLISTEFIVFRSKKPNEYADWLLPYLLCDDVQTILYWSQTGSNHPRLAKTTLSDLPIPNSVIAMKNELGSLVKSAIIEYENAKSFYPEAENELLERIGFDLTKQNNNLFYFESKSRLNSTTRIDAEHSHPKYKRIREHLESKGALHIREIRKSINRGAQPSFVNSGNVLVLASKAIRPFGVDLNEDARTDYSFWSDPANEKARVFSGDVLLNSTGLGTLGRASYYVNNESAIADNHVTIIRVNDDICLPAYLSLFLNSNLGLAQSEMFQTGSSGQLEIYPQHIDDFYVFIPRNVDGSIDIDWQKKLSDKIIRAYMARKTAHSKLIKAKKIIENIVKL